MCRRSLSFTLNLTQLRRNFGCQEGTLASSSMRVEYLPWNDQNDRKSAQTTCGGADWVIQRKIRTTMLCNYGNFVQLATEPLYPEKLPRSSLMISGSSSSM